MTPNQTLVADDGYEVMLFPLQYMYLTQGEQSDLSHYLAMDFIGYNGTDRVYQCPYYAPCSARCVASFGGDTVVWQSLDKVHCADGTLQVVTFLFAHDDNLPSVGTVKRQGQLIGHTGTAGQAYGDHVHFNTADGAYAGMVHIQDVQIDAYELKNSDHIFDICYVNDTVLVESHTGGYNWKTYIGPIGPTGSEKRKFPWFLYARRLRNER